HPLRLDSHKTVFSFSPHHSGERELPVNSTFSFCIRWKKSKNRNVSVLSSKSLHECPVCGSTRYTVAFLNPRSMIQHKTKLPASDQQALFSSSWMGVMNATGISGMSALTMLLL